MKALITGISGQSGSYLAELLLDKNYKVYGLLTQRATPNTRNIAHLLDQITLIPGDLTDQASINNAIESSQPDEVYNLGAQSFVKTSWDMPENTGNVNGLGVLRVLEAIKTHKPDARMYQASTSEMFGKVQETPQNEKTPFYPRSPYGVAKLYGHWIAVNYRESHCIHASCGILFNHDCVSEKMPLLVRRNNEIDVVLIDEIIPLRRKGTNIQQFEPNNHEVWDGDKWVKIKAVTIQKKKKTSDHRLFSLEARAGVADVTAHHNVFLKTMEKIQAKDVTTECEMAIAQELPPPNNWTVMTQEMAEFLGHLAAEGYISHHEISYTNNDAVLLDRVAELWSKLFLGSTRKTLVPSGFSDNLTDKIILQDTLPHLKKFLRSQLYNNKGMKRVPLLVMNSSVEVQKAFLQGYYAGDGLKAGDGESTKTSSPLLALGVLWIYNNLGNKCSVYKEQRDDNQYYQLNIIQNSTKGRHLLKNPNQVRRIIPSNDESEWVFDLETESGKFMVGVGKLIVSNSPRRGEQFVTQKIAKAAARIKLGLQNELILGDLRPRRDIGHAKDYVRAMWLMLQQEMPDDYVISSGQTHSIREMLDVCFGYVGLNWADYVGQSTEFMRPAEVDLLLGDSSKARKVLGWEPEYTFEQIMEEMVKSHLPA